MPAARFLPHARVWEGARHIAMFIMSPQIIRVERKEFDLIRTEKQWVVFGYLPETPHWRVAKRHWKRAVADAGFEVVADDQAAT